jgi:hypothetical protein
LENIEVKAQAVAVDQAQNSTFIVIGSICSDINVGASLIREEIKDIPKGVLREYEIEKGGVEEDLSTDITLLQGFI